MIPAAASRVLHLSFISLLLVSAEASAAAGPDVIAEGGTISLSASDVRTLVGALPAADRKVVAADAATLEKLVRTEIVSRALLGDARAKGFDKQAETVAQLDRLRDEALMRLWVASHGAVPVGYPSEDEIKAAFDANKAALVAPAQYRIAQIFISTPEGADATKLAGALRKASDLSGRVATGDFSKLAQEQSEHAESAGKGGDMGYLAENQLAPEVLAAVRPLKSGEVVGPVRTAQGLHFFKLLDRKAGAPLTLAEAHDGLANALRTRRGNELAQAYLAELNSKLAISVNQIELTKVQASLH
jgi:peptidylprolyl isomerase